MEKRTKRKIAPLMMCFFILYTSFITRAESLPQLYEGSATLADVIMSYYAMSGAGVANETWINNLYNSYGSSFGTLSDLVSQGALVMNEASQYIPTQSLEDAIANAPAYQSLNIGDVFNISSSEAAATGAVATTGAGTLAGALGGVATTGVLPILGAVTVAYWGGIALGTIAAHALGLYDEKIDAGVAIDTTSRIMNMLGDGSSSASLYFTSGTDAGKPTNEYVVVPPEGWIVFIVPTSGSGYFEVTLVNPTSNSYYGKYVNERGNTSNITVARKNYTQYGYTYAPNGPVLTLEQFTDNYLPSIKNGTAVRPEKKSPDLIGENGNLVAENNNGNITVPDMKPQIDPGTEAGKPLRLQDWLNFANGVKNNNSNTNPNIDGNEANKNLYLGMIDNIKVPNPSPNPNPDPDPNPDPYAPPNPTPTPDPDYGDPNPDQPEWESETGEIPDPVGTGNPWVLPDITDKFPFCIPKDLKTMAENFKSTNRQAPYISWRFNPPMTPIDYTFNLDLSDFEDVATLLRSLELIGFVVGLAIATRYLIGAT